MLWLRGEKPDLLSPDGEEDALRLRQAAADKAGHPCRLFHAVAVGLDASYLVELHESLGRTRVGEGLAKQGHAGLGCSRFVQSKVRPPPILARLHQPGLLQDHAHDLAPKDHPPLIEHINKGH